MATSYGSSIKSASDLQLHQSETRAASIFINGSRCPPNCPPTTSRDGRPPSRFAPHRWAELERRNDQSPPAENLEILETEENGPDTTVISQERRNDFQKFLQWMERKRNGEVFITDSVENNSSNGENIHTDEEIDDLESNLVEIVENSEAEIMLEEKTTENVINSSNGIQEEIIESNEAEIMMDRETLHEDGIHTKEEIDQQENNQEEKAEESQAEAKLNEVTIENVAKNSLLPEQNATQDVSLQSKNSVKLSKFKRFKRALAALILCSVVKNKCE